MSAGSKRLVVTAQGSPVDAPEFAELIRSLAQRMPSVAAAELVAAMQREQKDARRAACRADLSMAQMSRAVTTARAMSEALDRCRLIRPR